VVPVHIDGRNDWLFQTAGLIHPRLRTILLGRALLGRRHRSIDLVIGKAIPFAGNTDGRDDEAMMRYLRARTLALSARHAPRDAGSGRSWIRRRRQELERADQPWVLAREVGALPAEQHLIDTDRYAVYWATAAQIPRTLREIGRLREETFRTVGEGTGRALDLDRFDDHYLHLFLWDKARRAVVGAYRMGTVETILAQHDGRGLYTSTLFRYTPEILERLKPALEIGRAFIRSEYQRGYSPLLLLWKGIGAFIAANPRYSLLFGPISVSGEYSPASRAAIQGFLTRTRMQPEMAEEVVARNPARERGMEMIAAEDRELLFRNLAEVNRTVSDIEEDGREIPVLLRQYLRLGARVLDFNVDRAFADAMDVLIVVDLRRTERSILQRYLGAEGAERFLAHHGAGLDCEAEEAMPAHDRHEDVRERCVETVAAIN
jgi:putative hemolysin